MELVKSFCPPFTSLVAFPSGDVIQATLELEFFKVLVDCRSIAEEPLKGPKLTLEFASVVFTAVAARGWGTGLRLVRGM